MTPSALDALCDVAQIELPLLLKARESTADRLDRRRALLADAKLPTDVAVIFVGSWGRQEVTAGSDNDFYLLTRTAASNDYTEAVAKVEDALREEEREHCGEADAALREPGRENTFGGVVVMQDLVEKIGLNEDTNHNLTQRMLLVLESVSAHQPGLHQEAKHAVLASYLEPPIKGRQPPRLFLNDVVRYWRTMCVDFAGKNRSRDGQGWGLRNAKLRTTRKMLFASGLLPLLRCGELDEDGIERFVLEQFDYAPSDRVAEAFLLLDQPEIGARVFKAYEAFLRAMSEPDIRDALTAIESRPAADESELFQSVVRGADEVEAGLLDLLFADRLLEITRKYGIF